MDEGQCLVVVGILLAQRCVNTDIESCRHRIANALNGIRMVIAADQGVVDRFVVGVKSNLHTVQACCLQLLNQFRGKIYTVGVQAGYHSLGITYQLGNICPLGRLTASKGHHWHSRSI